MLIQHYNSFLAEYKHAGNTGECSQGNEVSEQQQLFQQGRISPMPHQTNCHAFKHKFTHRHVKRGGGVRRLLKQLGIRR